MILFYGGEEGEMVLVLVLVLVLGEGCGCFRCVLTVDAGLMIAI